MQLGKEAARHARERFDQGRNARAVEAVYDSLLGIDSDPSAEDAQDARVPSLAA